MKKVLIAFFALLWGTVVMASNAIEALEHFVAEAKTFSGLFTQNTISKVGKRIDAVSKGECAFKRPGKFIWKTTAPFAQDVVSDAQRLWLYEPDLNQVTVKNLKASLSATPAAFLFGSADIREGFTVEPYETDDSLLWVCAKPLHEDIAFERIYFAFNDEEELCAMRLVDHFGETTEYVFTEIKVNEPLTNASFRFTPPPGVELIDEKRAVR